jgi:hypothetical protein
MLVREARQVEFNSLIVFKKLRLSLINGSDKT